MATIHLEGVSEQLAAIDEMIARIRSSTEVAVRAGVLAIVAASAKEAPVRQGTLRRSIRATAVVPTGPYSWEGRVGPTVVYGRRIHEGFVGQTDSLGRTFTGPPPNRFMVRGLDRSGAAVAEVFRDGWLRAVVG